MLRKVILYAQSTNKALSSAQQYIDRFRMLQNKLIEQQRTISELKKQNVLAERAAVMTFSDSLRQVLCRITKSEFESAAMKQLRLELREYRNQLQAKIEESDEKWKQPREQIFRVRQELENEFLGKFINLDLHLQELQAAQIGSPDLAEGCLLTHRMLLSLLEKHGVEFFDAEVGSLFNPEEHETVDEGEAGKPIVAVHSRGWRIGEKVVKKPYVRL